jgi:hypothetical protein
MKGDKILKFEDIKVGMKVIPISKSYVDSFSDWLRHRNTTTDFLKRNGFLYVIRIDSPYKIILSEVTNRYSGYHFKPEDLQPYTEKKVTIKSIQETIIYEYQPYILTVTSESSKDNFEEVFVHNLEQERETAKVIFNGDTTICILEDGSKGITKRNPNDRYDKDKGQNIAYFRAKIKSLEKEIEKLSK